MGKWALWRLFRENPAIHSYLPATSLYNTAALQSYLQKYRTVYIKPDGGGRGIGVIKAWRTSGGYAFVKVKGTPVHCATISELGRKLSFTRKRPHVIQRGIDLAKVNGRAFDIRLMMMRNEKGKWAYAGDLAKVAGKSSVITNVARGKGYTLTLEEALRQSLGMDKSRVQKTRQEIIRLGQMCNRMHDRRRYDWQIGYDIGIDRGGKVWLIESNPTIPSHALFARLKDKTMYHRIKRMAAYNRRPKSKR